MGFPHREIGCQFKRSIEQFWQMHPFEKLMMFAPAIGLAFKDHVESRLLPVFDRREMGSVRDVSAPEIAQDRLSRHCSQAGQSGNGAQGRSNILAQETTLTRSEM